MIQYLQDNVQFNPPTDVQTDWEAVITIVFAVVVLGVAGNPVTYTQTITGGTSQDQLVLLYNEARTAINDATLVAYAAAQNAGH